MNGMNVGVISTRISGLDGVSLETAKWAQVLHSLHHNCSYFAGRLDTPPDTSMLVGPAHFKNPHIRKISNYCFSHTVRSPSVSKKIHVIMMYIKGQLYEFVKKFQIQVIMIYLQVTKI